VCRLAAEDYARLHRQLRAHLHRASCPPSLALGEYALRLLPSSAQARLVEHLRICAYCTAELRWLGTMLDCALPLGEQHEYDASSWLAF